MATQMRTWFGADKFNDRKADETARANDPRWLATRFLVEAGEREHTDLWAFNSSQSPWRYDQPRRTVEWAQTSPGYGFEVGRLADMPVVVSVQWDYIDGELVCFWEPTSVVVDYRLIEPWLKEKFPNAKTRTNAMNFHNVVLGIEQLHKRSS